MNHFVQCTILVASSLGILLEDFSTSFALEAECSKSGSSLSLDRGCLDQHHLLHCNLNSEYDSCAPWLGELLSSNQVKPDLIYELYIGLAHQALASLSKDEQDSDRHRIEAMNFYNLVLQKDSNNVDATYGIASLSEPGVDRIEQLQKILEVQPDDAIAGRSITSNISRASGNNLEAAVALESVFDEMDESLSKWNISESIILYYENAGATDEVSRFKEKAVQILSPDEKINAFSNLENVDLEQIYLYVSILCYESVVAIIGDTHCFESLNRY